MTTSNYVEEDWLETLSRFLTQDELTAFLQEIPPVRMSEVYAKLARDHESYREQRDYEKAAKTLCNAFSWVASKKGNAFWTEVYRKIIYFNT